MPTRPRRRHTATFFAALTGLLPCLLATLGACSTEAWYEGAKRSAEHQCRQQPPGAAEECLARVNKTRYDTYEKERTTPR